MFDCEQNVYDMTCGVDDALIDWLSSSRLVPYVVIHSNHAAELDDEVAAAIDRLLADRTSVIIAHRLATVERADDILILDSGRVLEYGARRALAQDDASHFHRLLQAGLSEVLA